MLNIYGHFLSMPSNKVRYCVNYLGLPFEYHHIDLAVSENSGPAYLEINPVGKVPAITDDGFHLGQSDAINRYLCAISGPSPFYPDDIKAQAKVNQWNDYASQHIQQAMSRVFFNKIVAPMIGEEPDEKSLAFGQRMLERDLPHFNLKLAHDSYILGESLTLADIALIAALDPSDMVGLDLSKYPHIVKWRKTVMERGFYRRTHAFFGEELQKA